MVERLGVAEKEIAGIFQNLKKRWKNETAHLSSMAEIINNPNYRAVIAMDTYALPYLFDELQNDPDHWFAALPEITGENPVNEEDAGNLTKMTNSWLDWGREKGFVESKAN